MKVIVAAALVLVPMGQARADVPAGPVGVPAARMAVAATGKLAGLVDRELSGTRVREVFRVFGEDETQAATGRSTATRRKAKRSPKARKQADAQKCRCRPSSADHPDGILVVLDGAQ